MLARSYRERGIEVRTDAPVTEVRRVGEGLEVVLKDGSTVTCDTVVHGAGRVPDLAGLDLAAASIAFTSHGVDVDAEMRSTTNPRVFAVGDAAALGAPLTPVGVAEARVAVRNILQPGSAEFDGSVVPSVVFADPPLASVGLTEAAAAAGGIDVHVTFNDTSAWESSRRVGVGISGAKVLVARGSGRIVGAHLLEHNADEVINVFAAAMLGGLTADRLKASMWAYPTAGSEIVYLV
jgi:glutathione reductase (NADPH)